MPDEPPESHEQTSTGSGPAGPELTDKQTPEDLSSRHIPEGLTFDARTTASLTNVVNLFKTGRYTKIRAIAHLARILPASVDGDPSSDSELEAFVSMLDSYEAYVARALDRSSRPDGLPADDDSDERDTPEPIGNGGTGGHSINNVGRPARKRASDFDEEDSAPEAVDPAAVTNKKPKIFEQDQPWYSSEALAQSFLSPSLVETRRILRGFSGDLPAIKRWIATAASVPFLPDSEWDSIVRGRSVNLDLVLSAIYSTTPVTDNTERIGTLEFRVGGSSEPTKTVRTHGEWIIAWNAAVQGTIFCFPHRAAELRSYGESITRMFMALAPSSHPRIFNYDKAVRARVGQLNNLLLTDYGAFSDLKMQWIDILGFAGGTDDASPPKGSSSKRSSTGRQDFCNRFNHGNCPDSAGRCRWKHICRKCKKSGHGANNCTAGGSDDS